MLYLVGRNSKLPEYVYCGKFDRSRPFTHSARVVDFFDIMVGIKGTLYITQEEREYALSPNTFVTLFPGMPHFGHRECPAGLSYYWCHFHLREGYALADQKDILPYIGQLGALQDFYIIPEYGEIPNSERVNQLFNQLVDYSLQSSYTPRIVECALSLLMLELTQIALERLGALGPQIENNVAHRQMKEIQEWIRLYCGHGLSVGEVANQFGYNPDYLSTAFRKMTGLPLLAYIHKTQISMAKRQLLTSAKLVKEIARDVGFRDEKHFMKVFKNHEGVSPTQYRNAYARAHISNV